MSSTQNFYKTFDLVRKRMQNKLCIVKIDGDQITLRSDIADFDEALVFLAAYEGVTNTHFKISVSKETTRAIDQKRWNCSHRSSDSQSSEVPVKCPAKIVILFKKVTKQSKTKDAYLRRNPPFRAVIKIDSNHNHLMTAPDASIVKPNHLKISSPVKECFFEYFKRGIYGNKAKSFHEQNLQKVNFHALNDTSMNPPVIAIHALYLEWKKMIASMNRTKAQAIQESQQAVNARVKQCFFQYFKRGFFGAAAKELHEHNLKKANFLALKDGCMNPLLPAIELLYLEWRELENAQIKKEFSMEENVSEPPRAESISASESTEINSSDFIDNIAIKCEIEFDEDVDTNFDEDSSEDIKPVLNIKQEIEDDSYGLPVIASYGSLADTETSSTFLAPSSDPPQPSAGNPASAPIMGSNNTPLVIYSNSSNTYKAIKCLPIISKYLSSVNHSSNQYNSYLPFTMSPARITSHRV